MTESVPPPWPDFEPVRKPYVSHFLMIDKLLTEVDGVQSFIRIVDLFAANGSSPPFNVAPTLSIGVRGVEGKGEIELNLLGHSIETDDTPRVMVFFSTVVVPDDLGTDSITLNVIPALSLPHLGNYRFSLIAGGRELGRIDFVMQQSPVPIEERRVADLRPQYLPAPHQEQQPESPE